MSQTAIEKGRFVQYPLHLIYEKSELTRDDKWVIISLMGTCWTEGSYRLSYREIAKLADVPLSLLSSYTDKNGKLHEGIMDRIERVTGYVHTTQGKELSTSGTPRGNAQSYITINYEQIWKDNVAYCESKKQKTLQAQDYQPVSNTNRLVSNTNKPVLHANEGVSNTNKPVSVASSKEGTYITYTNIDNLDKKDTVVSATQNDASLTFHPLYNFIALDDPISPKTMIVYLTSKAYESEMEDDRRAFVAQEVKYELEQQGHTITYRWERTKDAVVVNSGIVPSETHDNHSHSEQTSSQSQNSTTIIEPSQSTQISPSTSLPGFEPPTSNPKQQTPKNALEVAKLALPTNEQVWSAETLVQTLEFHRGRVYPNGAKRKSDRVRDVELEAAKTLMVDAADIWQGHTTEQNAATLIRIVQNLETKWWLDTNGNILPHQLVDKDRIHTAHKRIQAATLMTTSTTTPIDFTAQKEAARIKNLANIEKMKRIKAKQEEERKQQAGKKRAAI